MIKKYEKLICVVILCITFIIIACIAKSAIIQAASTFLLWLSRLFKIKGGLKYEKIIIMLILLLVCFVPALAENTLK